MLCNSGEVENEHHFFFDCEFYKELRDQFMSRIDVSNQNRNEQLENLFVYNSRQTAHYIKSCYIKRRNYVYNLSG